MNSGRKREVNENLLKKWFAPGFWMDQNDALHLEVPALLAAFELPDTPENRDQLVQMANEVILKQFPDAVIRRREKPPDYTAS